MKNRAISTGALSGSSSPWHQQHQRRRTEETVPLKGKEFGGGSLPSRVMASIRQRRWALASVLLLSGGLAVVLWRASRSDLARITSYPLTYPREARPGSAVALNGGLRGYNKDALHPGVILSTQNVYCSADLAYPAMSSASMDAADAAGLKLLQLQVTIRHGDRSAIHTIPGAGPSSWSCDPFTPEVEAQWKKATLRYNIVSAVDGSPMERALWPALLAEPPPQPLPAAAGKDGAGSEQEAGKNDATTTGGGSGSGGQGGSSGGGGRKSWSPGACAPGQLTEAGLRQHLSLGAALRRAYQSRLGGLAGGGGAGLAADGGIYVRSTDYTRTLQSAGALLLTLLPGAMAVTMAVHPDEGDEIMHGVGLRSSSNVAGGGEKEFMGSCPLAVRLSKAQNADFQMRSDVSERLAVIFGAEAVGRTVTELTDNVHARVCHNMTLPCSDEGCMTSGLARSMMAESDRSLCLRYAGAVGGHTATQLAMYPFLLEVLEGARAAAAADVATTWLAAAEAAVEEAKTTAAAAASAAEATVAAAAVAVAAAAVAAAPRAAGAGDDGADAAAAAADTTAVDAALMTIAETLKAADAKVIAAVAAEKAAREALSQAMLEAKKFKLFSGHDTVIAPVLAAIGAYDCTWPPYASHVSFELWSCSVDCGPAAVADAAPENDAAPPVPAADRHFMRIIYNGRPVTRLVHGCREWAASGALPFGRDFCPLRLVESTVEAALRGENTLAAACKDRGG